MGCQAAAMCAVGAAGHGRAVWVELDPVKSSEPKPISISILCPTKEQGRGQGAKKQLRLG